MRRSVSPFVLIFMLMALSQGSFACKLEKNSPWYDSEDKLVSSTSVIAIAKLSKSEKSRNPGKFEYVFEVVRLLKGKPNTNSFSVVSSAAPNRKTNQTTEAVLGKDCSLEISFIEGKEYLIFVNSFNPKGYKPISGQNDQWVKEIEKRIAGRK